MILPIASLEAALIKTDFSPELRFNLDRYASKVEFSGSRLILKFLSLSDQYHEGSADLYHALQQEISTNAVLARKVKALRFESPLESVEYAVICNDPFDGLSLPVLSECEILRELHNNWQEDERGQLIKLPANFVAMSDGKTLLCSNDIEGSCGVSKAELLRVPSNSLYFPDDEHQRYTQAITEAAGQNLVIGYKAPKVNDARLFDRKVEARLVRSEWGEVCRLVKLLQLPRAID